MNQGETFATAFNCMDGRCQDLVISWAKKNFGVRFVDTVTEPGIDKILGTGEPSTIVSWVRKKAEISAGVHGSKKAVVVGHLKCAGNPVIREEHISHILDAVKQVQSWNLFDDVIGLLFNKDWEIEIIPDSKKEQVMAA